MQTAALSVKEIAKYVFSAAVAGLALSACGYAKTQIVLPDVPSCIETFAAKELKYHLENATGRILPIVGESRADGAGLRFYIGNVVALAKVGIDAGRFEREERLVKGVGGNVYLAGGDGPAADKSAFGGCGTDSLPSAGGGTLYAVYDFLEKEMGVRWLWPGELGEVIPQRGIPPMDGIERRGREPLFMRRLRGNLEESRRITIANRLFGWKYPANARRDVQLRRLWCLRNRLGARRSYNFGHAFIDWPKRFRNRPDLFAMQPGGLRGRFSDLSADDEANRYYTMCVSNPKLHDMLVDFWAGNVRGKIAPNVRPPCINCCDNDSGGFCSCSRCRSWDADDPGFAASPYWSGAVKELPLKERFSMCKTIWDGEGDQARGVSAPSVTDRYVRFYNAVVEKARKVHPLAEVCAYAYVNYTKPPKEVQVADGVVISIVPDISFPYSAAQSRGFRETWLGWNKMGASQMFYRPNYMFNGGSMPYSSARRMAEDINFAYGHGMIAVDQDSLTGAWSAQAMKNYVAARILREPDATYEKMSEEFCSAFGNAAGDVRRYCEMLEELNERFSKEEWLEIGKLNRTKLGGLGGTGFTFFLAAPDIYTEEWFANADAILSSAAAKAAGAELSRVEFLRKGLKDGLLTYRTRVAQKSGDEKAFDTAFQTLLEYRASVEAEHVCDWSWHADMEFSYGGWPHKSQPYYLGR